MVPAEAVGLRSHSSQSSTRRRRNCCRVFGSGASVSRVPLSSCRGAKMSRALHCSVVCATSQRPIQA
eukprot:11187875-Lingulodinium_polyedra.AAC.1